MTAQSAGAGAGEVSAQVPRRRDWAAALYALMILGSVLVLRPCTYLMINHAVQIPYVQLVRDPSLYSKDAFVHTLGTFCSFYWLAIAKFDWLGLEPTLFVLYVLIIAGGLVAAALLARSLAPGSMLAPWAAAVLFGLGIWPLIGGGTIAQYEYAEQTSLSVVFFILAFAAAMRNRPFLWAVAFGLGFLANQGYGVHVGLYFLIWGGMELAAGRLERRWLYGVLLAAVLASPALIWSYSVAAAAGHTLNDPNAMRAWAGVKHGIGAPHFYPLSVGWQRNIRLLLVLVITGAVALRDQDKRRRSLVLASVTAATAWVAFGFIVAYALPPSEWLILQGARGADLFYVIAAVYFVSILARYYERPGGDRKTAFLAAIGLVGLFLGQALIGKRLLILLVAVPLIYPRVLAVLNPARIRAVLCLALLASALLPALMPGGNGLTLYRFGPSPEMREIGLWARDHTDKDALFMINPGADWQEGPMFRPLAMRSVFVTSKDGTAISWDASFLGEFLRRMNALGMVTDLPNGRLPGLAGQTRQWQALSDAALLAVAREYGVDYAIFDTSRATKLPVVHQNERYKIVAFRG